MRLNRKQQRQLFRIRDLVYGANQKHNEARWERAREQVRLAFLELETLGIDWVKIQKKGNPWSDDGYEGEADLAEKWSIG